MNTYNPIEPTVIDEELLKKTSHDQAHGDAAEIARKEGIDPADVQSLHLDYKNILKIDNLWAYEHLTKLQLDNNIIEKIENINFLKNLQWLDLSFNNISVIEGLEGLTKLTDLTLFNNRITKLENMNDLLNLTVFSIGNNALNSLENLSYLSRFENLRLLNVSGNPLCKNPEHKNYILAHLKSLKYFDYRLVDEDSIKVAKEKYMETLMALDDERKVNATRKDEEQAETSRQNVYKNAHMDNIDSLFERMFETDNDYYRFYPLAKEDLDHLRDDYYVKYFSVLSDMKQSLLKQQSLKEDERKQFSDCLSAAKRARDAQAIRELNEFQHFKKKLIKIIQTSHDAKEIDDSLNTLKSMIAQLSDWLMNEEMQMVEQFEDVIKEFERNYNDLCTGTTEVSQTAFSRFRELEAEFHEKAQEVVMAGFDRYAKTDVEELEDSIRDMIGDKDGLINALTSSHEYRLSRFDAQEDVINTGVAKDLEYQLQTVLESEARRNRNRVCEIVAFVDRCMQEIEQAEDNAF